MPINKYLYSFGYDATESELCKLESRSLFNSDLGNRHLFSNCKIAPSSSAFIKNRLDVRFLSDDYLTILSKIENAKICFEGFKVEYVLIEGDNTEYRKRLEKLKDIGYRIEGIPDYYNPTITYALCCCEDVWYFGTLIKDPFDWYKHRKKPLSYSNSIGINIAKSLVNIASEGNKEKKLLDACCGVGTIMLEACFSGFNIEGCDINWKVCRGARENLSHFNYETTVYRSDITDIDKRYDAAIIDLPYNLFSSASDIDIAHIIKSASEIAKRLVIVSITDIESMINGIGFSVLDYCKVRKKGKSNFERKIWVCEKSANEAMLQNRG